MVPMHYRFSHSPNFKYLFHLIVSLRCQTTCLKVRLTCSLGILLCLPAPCTQKVSTSSRLQLVEGHSSAAVEGVRTGWALPLLVLIGSSIAVGYHRATKSSLPGPHCTCRHSHLALLKVRRSQSLWQGPHICRVLSLRCCQERGPEQSSCKHLWRPSIEPPFKKQPAPDTTGSGPVLEQGDRTWAWCLKTLLVLLHCLLGLQDFWMTALTDND